MAGFGAALGGAARAYNQGYDEKRKLELAARLEQEREERKLKMTPVETMLATGEDGIVYRQPVNAYGEAVGPRKALSDIEAKAMQQREAMTQLEMDKGTADVTKARADATKSSLDAQLTKDYGARQIEDELLTSRSARNAQAVSANTSAAYGRQADALAAATKSEQSRRERGIGVLEAAILGDNPSPEQLKEYGALLVNPESAANNFTRPATAGANKLGLSRSNIQTTAEQAAKRIDDLTDPSSAVGVDEKDPRYNALLKLRSAFVTAGLLDPDGTETERLLQQLDELERGSTSATSSLIDEAIRTP